MRPYYSRKMAGIIIFTLLAAVVIFTAGAIVGVESVRAEQEHAQEIIEEYGERPA